MDIEAKWLESMSTADFPGTWASQVLVRLAFNPKLKGIWAAVVRRALLFGVYIGALDLLKIPSYILWVPQRLTYS